MHDTHSAPTQRCHCCPDIPTTSKAGELNRRRFLAGMTAGGALLSGVSWSALAQGAGVETLPMPPSRKPLVVLPVLIFDLCTPIPQCSWRGWGGVQSEEAATEEIARITQELEGIRASADFPVTFLPVQKMHDAAPLMDNEAVRQADLVLVYGAGGNIQGLQHLGKDVILFQRWKSGPVYLQYEIVSPRFLRQHTDDLALENFRCEDVVTDSLEELTWRLRALCGLKNTRDTRIITIGRPDVWAHSLEHTTELMERLRQQWRLDVQEVSYDELGGLIDAANADETARREAQQRADAYLRLAGTTLETKREFVENCFLLDRIFRFLMKRAECSAITVLNCMVTIMQKSKTSACLTLSTLNDDGYLAFCESDFAVIPSGILLANITGHPVFLNDPTYPHDQIITLAHCTAPRRMDGQTQDPARIVTHFESDYGAAPKVEMQLGATCTNIAPDFSSKRWVGVRGEVVDRPFRPICRSQIDVRYRCPDSLLANRMPGFHWMFCYGDYMREIGYALRRVGIAWEDLDKMPRTEFT